MTDKEKIKLFGEVFKGREDAYGKYNSATKKGECIKETFAESVIQNHLNGIQRIGRYPLSPSILGGAGTWWAVADIDENDIDLKINYPKQLGFEKSKIEKQVEVCVNGKKKGIYYGALTYKKQDSFAGVGIWMKIEIISDSLDKQESSLINLEGISSDIFNFNILIWLILVYTTLFLLLILALLSCRSCQT